MERIIVRRGRFRTYELLRRTFGTDSNIEILWDRRKAGNDVRCEKEALTQERFLDRRSRPPVEWERLDYLFTNGAKPAGSARKDPQLQ